MIPDCLIAYRKFMHDFADIQRGIVMVGDKDKTGQQSLTPGIDRGQIMENDSYPAPFPMQFIRRDIQSLDPDGWVYDLHILSVLDLMTVRDQDPAAVFQTEQRHTLVSAENVRR